MSAVYLGASLIAIEGMLRHGVFDQAEYFSLIGKAFEDTPWTPRFPENPIEESIGEEDLARMRMVANEDRTLASFFGSAISSLPRSMQQYLQDGGFLKSMDSVLIISDYILRTRLLIAEYDNADPSDETNQPSSL